MKHNFYTLILVSFFLSFCASSQTFKVGYPEFKPYTYTENGLAKGIGIETLHKLNQKLDLNIVIIPIETYGAGFTRLEKNKLDAVLLASQNAKRDEVATFSKPITFNNWSWFFINKPGLDYKSMVTNKGLKVATYKNANTHSWLKQQGYYAISPTVDLAAMLRQIDKGRISSIFISEQVMLDKLRMQNRNPDDFHILKQIQKPFGMYVSKTYLKQYPHFLTLLNEEISAIR